MKYNANLQKVSKQYKGFTLGPLELRVETGIVIALVGPNGSGKSTLLRTMMQLIQPDQGTMEITEQIGYAGGDLLQSYGHLTIRKLASFASYWRKNWDQPYFESLLQRYNIDETKKYNKCSNGTKKKVEFILSLAHHPDLLLLDEPTAGMDMMSQLKLYEDVLHFMDQGQRSVVIATHMMDDVKRICDSIYIIHQGKFIGQFDKDELQYRWARLWLDGATELPEKLKNHPHILGTEATPLQVITNHADEIEQELETKGLKVIHRKQLELSEIISIMIQGTG